jgi:phosphohistidine phosphatase SixA
MKLSKRSRLPALTPNSIMRIAVLLLLNLLAQHVSADDLLWQKLRTEADLVVLMRHTQPAGGNPLTWDESGSCKGESMLTVEGKAHARKIGEAFAQHGIKPSVISSPMCRCRDTARIAFGEALVTDAALREIATADRERTSAFERKAQSLIASHRGSSPVVFVSHRPNIDLLSLELIGDGELLVARANENGELTVLGKIQVQP